MDNEEHDFWGTLFLTDVETKRRQRDEVERVCSTFIASCAVQLCIVIALIEHPDRTPKNIDKKIFQAMPDGTYQIPFRYGRQPVLIKGKNGTDAVDLHDARRVYEGLIERAQQRDPLLLPALIAVSRRARGKSGSSSRPSQAAQNVAAGVAA